MEKRLKFAHIVKSLKTNPLLWEGKLSKYLLLANHASLGFPIGEPEDNAIKALSREGYEVIVEMDDFVVGTNWLTSIVIVTENYGPWAVDITDLLFLNTKDNLYLVKPFQTSESKNSLKKELKSSQ